jgi:malate permease and related proteins
MGILIDTILPIALVALVGIWMGQTFPLDLPTLAKINIYALLPALVLTGVYKSTVSLNSTLGIVIGFLLNSLLLYAIAHTLGRLFKLSANSRKSLIATTLLANSGNMGLPFMLFALGQAGLERGIVYLIASAIFIATAGPLILKGEGLKEGLKVTLNMPVFWAALLGITLQGIAWQQGSQWQVPRPADEALVLLSDAAIPLALIMLGAQLSRTRLKVGLYEGFAACLRLFVSPLTAYGLGRLLGLQGIDLEVLVMQSAMPVAVNTLIWVTELGGDTDQVARTTVLSTLMSIGSLPLVLWLVQTFG